MDKGEPPYHSAVALFILNTKTKGRVAPSGRRAPHFLSTLEESDHYWLNVSTIIGSWIACESIVCDACVLI